MKLPTNFLPNHKEYEPLIERPIAQSLLDEYIRNDAERVNNATNYPVVYDSIEYSPNYDPQNGDPYIDEKDLIELPAPYEQGEG
eukprot:CAMPEP_0176355800 /NCGR_PEP_ID=MMETSP0126-20121128/13552_1 /TAXON_ID=141414 ORGANISM="Strombidinopsis acuminatum, Strain SPMC142" /NCGR_SAMPLE_ID=MMETSP0126 /ASSEMBLY_ACC=CAM_ASM_000229 /LENGTH=83 /DNA_ID=CAMNT_0017708603 /DNA_START=823 /DNA_END=1074 /DNA_ORIENTATION=-